MTDASERREVARRAEVVSRICDGDSVEDIAIGLGWTIESVRSITESEEFRKELYGRDPETYQRWREQNESVNAQKDIQAWAMELLERKGRERIQGLLDSPAEASQRYALDFLAVLSGVKKNPDPAPPPLEIGSSTIEALRQVLDHDRESHNPHSDAGQQPEFPFGGPEAQSDRGDHPGSGGEVS